MMRRIAPPEKVRRRSTWRRSRRKITRPAFMLWRWLGGNTLLPLLGLLLPLKVTAPTGRWAGLTGLLPAGMGLVLYAVVSRQRSRRRFKVLLDSLITAALVSSLLTIFIALTALRPVLTAQNTHLVQNGQNHLLRMRVQIEEAPASGHSSHSSASGSARLSAAFLTLTLPLQISVLGSPARLVRRLSAAAGLLASSGALAVTGGFPFVWPGLAAGLVALGLIKLRFRPDDSRRQRILTGILAGMMGQIPFCLWSLRGQEMP